MIPQTLGALAAFLGLVAPGLTFELVRERKRAQVFGSTFREASRVALASFTLVTFSVIVQAITWAILPTISIDINKWIKLGNLYLQENAEKIAINLAATTIFACALGYGLAFAISKVRKERASLSNGSAWQEALRSGLPDKGNAWAHVQLRDGTAFFGYVESYTLNEKPEDREILLQGITMQRAKMSDSGDMVDAKNIGKNWEKVAILASQISYIRIQYRDADGNPLPSKRRTEELETMDSNGGDQVTVATPSAAAMSKP
jgi:hypothetical protein